MLYLLNRRRTEMIQIKENVYWTGVRDWDLRSFHGHELSTHKGSSYNSYLIKDDKNVLVDTVWYPFMDEFAANLEKDIGIENIDYIVVNHCEPDHGGSLGYILDRKPDIPIYCTKNGAEIIKKHFHKDWNFNIVKTGDTLRIGKCELVFVEMQMIHWPDSMMTFVKGPNVLLSNDAFGQHYSSKSFFNDQVDNCELYQEAVKYFGNILAPFTAPIKKKIQQVVELDLPIEMIAPSHGVIWRDNPLQIVNKYAEWADEYDEGYAVILYDTMYDATKNMGEAIGQGLAKHGVQYKLFNSSVTDNSDLMTELFKAKFIIVGSCTVNNGVLRSIAGMLDEIKGHKLKGKIGAAFGSYGWSGEAHKHIQEELTKAGIKMPFEPLGFKYRATREELDMCVELGEKLAKSITE
jgi:Uncharacterized flavoproteins